MLAAGTLLQIAGESPFGATPPNIFERGDRSRPLFPVKIGFIPCVLSLPLSSGRGRPRALCSSVAPFLPSPVTTGGVKWRLLQFGGKLRGNLHAANGIAKEPKRPIGQLLISRPLSVVPGEHLVGTDAVQRGHELMIRKHRAGPAAATDQKV